MSIPNRFHFCFGFAPQAEEFLFAHYLAIKSAVTVNRPDSIHIYYGTEPRGHWWDRARALANAQHVDPPLAIFGRPLKHYAHRSDVFRLATLIDQGGIYLDIDTLCLKPFGPLLSNEFVMGEQLDDDGRVRGLCNAVMLARPGAIFLRRWYEEYRTFRSEGMDDYWDEHSVELPQKLRNDPELRDHITVLNHRAFFYPACNCTDELFVYDDLSAFGSSFCVHLWEQITHDRLRSLTPETVRTGESAYCRLARKYLDEDE